MRALPANCKSLSPRWRRARRTVGSDRGVARHGTRARCATAASAATSQGCRGQAPVIGSRACTLNKTVGAVRTQEYDLQMKHFLNIFVFTDGGNCVRLG